MDVRAELWTIDWWRSINKYQLHEAEFGASLPQSLATEDYGAKFVAKLWKTSDQPVSVPASPVVNGWVVRDDGYRIIWYDRDQVSSSFGQIL